MSEVNQEIDGEDDSSPINPTSFQEAVEAVDTELEMDSQQFFISAYTTLRECMKEVYGLQAREDFILKDKEKIHAEILEGKNFLEEKPEYQKFLQNLQKALYEQNINVFNQLLTYFVRDVLKTDKAIEMELFVSRNMPGIRIEAVNGGFKENIIDGSGGAIANIVSTGLRLICLSRLPHRKFIILDEPDCWIKPEFVPAFAKIIGELSRKLRIQTIIISHHSWEYFKDYGRVIELDKDGAILETHIMHDTTIDEQTKKQDYIKEVNLRRFMSHYNTKYELHPFLTCIIGKNDLGKSVIAAAMKALAFNDSSDSCVMHNENSAQVFAETSMGDGFLWERFKVKEKGQEQKVKYTLFKDGEPITSEFNSYDVPEFINSKLRIMKSEEIDVHISSQKTPVFMIGNDVSPANKAKILSLGKEILVIQQMMSHINSKASEFSARNKKHEPLYEQYVRELKLLAGVENYIPKFDELEQQLNELKAEIEEVKVLEEILPELEKFEELKKIQPISTNLHMPNFEDEENINRVIAEIDLGNQYLKIKPVKAITDIPIFEEEDEINQILWEIDLGRKYSQVKPIAAISNIPTFEDVSELNTYIKRIESLNKLKSISTVKALAIPEFEEEDEINQILSTIYQHNEYAKIEKITPLPLIELEDLKAINETITIIRRENESIDEVKKNIAKLMEEKAKLEVKQKELEEKIREEYENSDHICPTCKQQVSFEIYKEHLL